MTELTALETAQQLIETWVSQTRHQPLDQCGDRLAHAIAIALDAASQDAYARGFRDSIDAELKNGNPATDAITRLAAQSGAQVWLLRGIENPDLIYNLPAGDPDWTVPLSLAFENASLFLIARFETGDGGPDGIEFHAGDNPETLEETNEIHS